MGENLFRNWDEAIAKANELGDECAGISMNRRGFTLRKTDKLIKVINRSHILRSLLLPFVTIVRKNLI